ncbi:MAG: hypothetical protein KU37_02640 [Sulfuricurvum sp. PC08-66]|nr:MAG: hypothetical protein KU37_02640 [Sulfuricurvum sp. PC08-66]
MAKDTAYYEMLIHTPLCTHKAPKKVALFSDDAQACKQEMSRHVGMHAEVFSLSSLEKSLSSSGEKNYDVVIIDGALPNERTLLAHLNRATSDEAVVAFNHDALLSALDATRKLFDAVGEYYKIVMPYAYEANATGTARGTHILASKFYHPTADIILQRSDLIDGLSYYNSDVHPASFAQPNRLRQALKGVARN